MVTEINGFWFKRFMVTHQLSKCLGKANLVEWMMKAKNTLIQKDPHIYTYIYTYILLVYNDNASTFDLENHSYKDKINIYYTFECNGLFMKEQNECYVGIRGTNDILYIGQHILKKIKEGWKNSHGMYCLRKVLWYDPRYLDNRMSKMHRVSNKIMETGKWF